MRPALLVIIMDFLVSSLLLFIEGPGQGRPEKGELGGASYAEEFSPAAVAGMEADWAREYQAELTAFRFVSQKHEISNLVARVEQVSAAKAAEAARAAELDAELGKTQSDLNARQRDLQALVDEKAGLTHQVAALDQTLSERGKLLAEREVALATRDATINSQQGAISNLTAQYQSLETLMQEQQKVQTALQDVQAGQQTVTTVVTGAAATVQAGVAEMTTAAAEVKAGSLATQERLNGLASNQVAMDERVVAIQTGQDRMQSSLDSVASAVTNLPVELRAIARDTALRQDQLAQRIGDLAGSIPVQTAPDLQPDLQALVDQVGKLAEAHTVLQGQLGRLVGGGGAVPMAADMDALRDGQETIENQLSDLAAKMDGLNVRRPGPFRSFRDARVELAVDLRETQTALDLSWPAQDTFQQSIFLPVLGDESRRYILIAYKDLGLDWSGINSDLDKISYTLKAEGAAEARTIPHSMVALQTDARVIRVELPAGDVARVGLSNSAPLKVIGRAGLEARGMSAIHVFKRTSQGVTFEVTASLDMNDPRYLLVKRDSRQWVNVIKTPFRNPDAQPDVGDFVVTAEGEFIGIMVDYQRCLIISDSDTRQPGLALPLDDLNSFVRAVRQLRKSIP